jgi:hypothetical protein
MAGHGVGDGRAAALVDHRFHLEPGAREEEGHGEVADRADAGRGEAELAGVRLGVLHQLLEAVGGNLVVAAQREGVGADDRDRREVLHRVVVDLLHMRHHRELRARR